MKCTEDVGIEVRLKRRQNRVGLQCERTNVAVVESEEDGEDSLGSVRRHRIGGAEIDRVVVDVALENVDLELHTSVRWRGREYVLADELGGEVLKIFQLNKRKIKLKNTPSSCTWRCPSRCSIAGANSRGARPAKIDK